MELESWLLGHSMKKIKGYGENMMFGMFFQSLIPQ